MYALEATDFTLPGPPQDGGLTLTLTRLRPSIPPEGQTRGERVSLLFIHGISYRASFRLVLLEIETYLLHACR